MDKLILSKEKKVLRGEVTLTASKSESNRVLIIRALSGKEFPVHNLARARDTSLMLELLEKIRSAAGSVTLDAGPAGTTFRFLTAYLSIRPGEYILTGSERMKERPIGILTEALKKLGAHIGYLEKEGYPPLKITGGELRGNALTIDGSVSSQYITALLLIAPVLPGGLKLRLSGVVSSVPYIRMTLRLLDYFGVKAHWDGDTITVEPQAYVPGEFTVEGDWSAASYWYAMAALADEAEFRIHGLNKESLQGDSVIAQIMTRFGISTVYESGSVLLQKKDKGRNEVFEFDFSDCPDLAQTVAVVAAATGTEAVMSGLHSLRIKETDRIAALQNELKKFGAEITEIKPGTIRVVSDGKLKAVSGNSSVRTYEDHRMAMAFAPLAFRLDSIAIDNPGVAEKSYPDFWRDLERAGFSVKW